MIPPAEVARRRARRQRLVWILALLAVLAAAAWVGLHVWHAYGPLDDRVPATIPT